MSASLLLSSHGMNAHDDMSTGVVNFRMPVWQFHVKNGLVMSPVVTFMNKNEHKLDTLFSVDRLGMELNTTFHDRQLADHLVASTTLDADHWILFDSGASATFCPKNLGKEWPLLPLNGEPPALRSISGQPVHVYGRRLILMTLDGVPVCFHFYVCDVLIRLYLLRGYFCRDTK